VAALGAILAVGAGARSSFFGRIGPQPDGTGITPNHWTLTPAGLQVEVGDRPLGLAWMPDGRHLVVSNNGNGVQGLVLLDAATHRVVQAIPYASPEALFLGVVVAPDGRRVYASAGGNNKIRVYDFDGHALAERAPIPLGDARARIYPAGLAVSPDGGTLYAALNLDNAVAFVDTATGRVRLTVRLAQIASAGDVGPLPYALVLAGGKLYVSEWNGGGVAVVDVAAGALLRRVPTGGHPSGLALAPGGGRLYVANATSDTVSVIDTARDAVAGSVDLSPYPGAPMGSMPNAVAVSPDGKTVYVANGGNNDVAVVDAASLALRGLIPTAWFPSALAVSPDGRLLYVTNMKGLGAGPNPLGPNPERRLPTEQYIAAWRGHPLDHRRPRRRDAGPLHRAGRGQQRLRRTRQRLLRRPRDTTPRAIPAALGPQPDPPRHLRHQGEPDLRPDPRRPPRDGDPGLGLFGRDVTPNHHALAETFVLFDHCYADAEVSADGHNWSTAAVATDYVQKTWPANYSGRNRPYDFEGG
jgi:YVTN family beta-propeller protein